MAWPATVLELQPNCKYVHDLAKFFPQPPPAAEEKAVNNVLKSLVGVKNRTFISEDHWNQLNEEEQLQLWKVADEDDNAEDTNWYSPADENLYEEYILIHIITNANSLCIFKALSENTNRVIIDVERTPKYLPGTDPLYEKFTAAIHAARRGAAEVSMSLFDFCAMTRVDVNDMVSRSGEESPHRPSLQRGEYSPLLQG